MKNTTNTIDTFTLRNRRDLRIHAEAWAAAHRAANPKSTLRLRMDGDRALMVSITTGRTVKVIAKVGENK